MNTFQGNIYVPENARNLSELNIKYPKYEPNSIVNGIFSANGCDRLESLIGAPIEVIKEVDLFECKKLNSLEGIPKICHSYMRMSSCDSFTSFNNVHKFITGINSIFYLPESLESNILGLLLIKKLDFCTGLKAPVMDIMNRHLSSGKDVLECQEELIEKGFKEYAKL